MFFEVCINQVNIDSNRCINNVVVIKNMDKQLIFKDLLLAPWAL